MRSTLGANPINNCFVNLLTLLDPLHRAGKKFKVNNGLAYRKGD